MPRPLTVLGGNEWEQLGLALGPEGEGVPAVWRPSWHTLLPCIEQANGSPALLEERVALVYLESEGDLSRAREKLTGAEASEGGRWLLLQIALQQRSAELLRAWLGASQGAVDRVVGAFIHTLLLEGAPEPEAWAGGGEAVELGRLLVLGRAERWDELAAALEQEGETRGLLLAAVLRGLLKQPRRQRKDLQQCKDAALLAAEALLDLKLSGPGDPADALVQRAAALAAHEELVAEACASQVMSMLRGKGPTHERPQLNPKQAASAWWHLDALVDRVSGAVSSDWYREQAERAPGPLSDVMRVRAAELLAVAGEWAAALEALPSPDHDTLLGGHAARLRVLALLRLERWDSLAEALYSRLERLADSEQQAILAGMISVLSMLGEGAPQQELDRLTGVLGDGRDSWLPLSAALLLSAGRRAGDREALAGRYAELAERLGGAPQGALSAFGTAVTLLEAHRHAEARQAFAGQQQTDGDDPVGLAGLAIALQGEGAWGEVADTLARLAALVPPAEALFLLREAAHVAAVDAEDLDRASSLLQQALELFPEESALLLDATAVELRRGNERQAVQLLDRAADHCEDPLTAADILCARGKYVQEKIGDAKSAEESYRRALKVHPLHVRSLHGLYHLLVKLQRFRDLPEVLHSLLHLTKTDAGRVKLLNNLASLHLKLWRKHGEEEDARSCVKYSDEALELRPRDEAALKNVVTVCEGLGRWDEIISRFKPSSSSPMVLRGLGRAYAEKERWSDAAPVFRRLAEKAEDADISADAALRAGDIYRDQLDDAKIAEECYRWAARRRANLEVGRRLADLLRSQERPEELAVVLEEQLPQMETAERGQLHVELGRLYAGALAQPRDAIRHYTAALEVDASNQEVMIALEPLLEQSDRPAELAHLLERRLQLLETGPEELRLLLRLGQVYEESGDLESAQRMATRLHGFYLDDEEAASLVERVYTALQRHPDLRDLYDRRVQFLEQQGQGTEADRAALLRRKGGLEYRELSDSAAAAQSLTRALELEPGDGETQELLAQVLTEEQDWQRLLVLHERRANGLESVEEQIACLHKAARVAQHKLGDEAETARLYERIHALDPSDAESFAFLEKKLERLQDDRRLAALLEKRAETVSSASDAVECLIRAASIREKVGDATKAREIYDRVLGLSPDSQRALKALARIYEALESWDEFLEVTKRQIDGEAKSSTKALLFFKCGSVLETKYQREEEAIRYYKQAIKTSPSCLPALHSLRDLYSRREDWTRVVQTLKTESSVWTDPKGKAGVLAQIADLYATKLNDHGQAFKYYREAIQNHPENMRAALALFEAYANQGSYSDAAAWGEVYARQVQQRGSREQRAEFFVRWAEVLRRIERYEDAAQFLVKAHELRPEQHETLFGLLDLCRVAPQAYDFGRAFDELLKDATKRNDNTATSILFTSCGVLAEQNGDVDAALDLYDRALAAAGHKIRLARPMADLLVLLGRGDEAVRLVSRCLEEAKDESFTRWIEAMQWLVEHEILWRRNYERAAERCEEALEEQPNRDDIRLLLADVRVMLKQPEMATEEYQRICDKLAKHGLDLQQLAQRYHALGLAAEKAGNLQLAESSWRRAGELAPEWPYPLIALTRAKVQRGEAGAEADLRKAAASNDHPDLARALAILSAEQGHHDRATKLLWQLSERADVSSADRVLLARQLTRTDAQQARRLLREVIRTEPDYLPAVEELSNVAEAAGNAGLARRARQVVALATGERLPKPAPLASGEIPKAFWARLEKDLSRTPVTGLWQLLRERLDELCAPEPPPSEQVAYPEVQLASAQMGALFGTRLEICHIEDSPAFMLGFGSRLMVQMDISALRIVEARTLLALAHATIKLGYTPLLRLTPHEKRELALRLAELLTGELDQFPQAAEIVAGQSRGKLRQMNKLINQQRIPVSAVEDMARGWLNAMDAAAIKVTLLLTEDLPSLARILAVQAGLAIGDLNEGGVLGAVPGLTSVTEYYLSDDYEQMREMLSFGESESEP